ncbi:hypothetical protein NMG60_11031634 [Bertholletia excelsa]
MSSSSSLEAGPVEDVVQALMEYLVDPLLPLKSSGLQVPSLDKQQVVAKQVYAVVLLYNYYQRKLHREVEFLGFESFCKLAVTLRPALMGHMKLMLQSDYSELNDIDTQLSVAEKAIMNACDISLVLDASKDTPRTKGWSVSKVAVLLVDSNKNNCLLQFSSVTHGGKQVNKRKRDSRKQSGDETHAEDSGFLQIALSAVKNVTGIPWGDISVLESHVVYSLSKERTTTQFYIMQCTNLINDDIQVPIKDVIESLQGPLVRKSSCSWTVTSVVEYFHMLPYAGILTDWFSRKEFSNSFQDLRVGLENVDIKSSPRIAEELFKDKDDSNENSNAADSVGNETRRTNTESMMPEDVNKFGVNVSLDSHTGLLSMGIDDSSITCDKTKKHSKNARNIVKVYHHQKRMSSADTNTEDKKRGVKVEMADSMRKPCVTEFKDENMDTIISSVQDEFPVGDTKLFSFQLSTKCLEKLQSTLASKGNALTQAALRVLLRKKYKLSRQLRNLEDEIAACDKNIQTILEGDEDDFILKIQAIIDGCNDVCLKNETGTQQRTCQHSEDQFLDHYRRKKLSEAVLTLRNSCQELDDICYENNWILPTYHIAAADGGYQADVIVKGMDFECSGASDLQSSPRLARNSAAAQLIVKLRGMAAENK